MHLSPIPVPAVARTLRAISNHLTTVTDPDRTKTLAETLAVAADGLTAPGLERTPAEELERLADWLDRQSGVRS